MGFRFATRIFLCFIIFCFLSVFCLAEKPAVQASVQTESTVNSLCYVCHIDLQTEVIASVHQKKGMGCDNCHGETTNHMHDEMLMTKPDVLIGRTEVKELCGKCHKSHKKPASVAAFQKKWEGRRRPNGRVINNESICTDCHGTHNIIKNELSDAGKDPEEWTSLFNGKDLTKWRSGGSDSWKIERGRIVIEPAKSGELLTEAKHKDYLLAVTFRGDWPIRGGIRLRSTDKDAGPMIEFGESKKPPAFAGSVSVPKKGLALVNLRKDLLDRGGWNTISRVEGNRVAVWLNGEEIGAVRMDMPEEGSIGFHVEKHRTNKVARLEIREVLIKPLGQEE
ncbi:MAG: family 16 glycoside hydrolase [Planctomycetota bacterium]|jgi:hypothetical protein